MKKLAIIGASYLQEPLIEKARSLGYQTHVFAWKTGDIGERTADFFYPLSIVEKEKILERCREIGIDGICTIASDLAVVTVNYVAASDAESLRSEWRSFSQKYPRLVHIRPGGHKALLSGHRQANRPIREPRNYGAFL